MGGNHHRYWVQRVDQRRVHIAVEMVIGLHIMTFQVRQPASGGKIRQSSPLIGGMVVGAVIIFESLVADQHGHGSLVFVADAGHGFVTTGFIFAV